MKGEEEIGGDECDETIIESETQEGDAAGWEHLNCAPCKDPDAIDADIDIEAKVRRAATDPGQPIQVQRNEHILTIFPFRSWCKSCVRGRALDAPSRNVKAQFTESIRP